jgi:hypothetical protein
VAPDYDAARGLWGASTAAGDHRAALAAVAPVSDASPLAIEAASWRRHARAPAGCQGLHAARGPARARPALVLNNLGVVRLRAAAVDRRPAAWYFSRARTLDPPIPTISSASARTGRTACPGGRVLTRRCGAHRRRRARPHAQVLRVMGQSAEACVNWRSRRGCRRSRISNPAGDAPGAAPWPGQLKEVMEPPRAAHRRGV